MSDELTREILEHLEYIGRRLDAIDDGISTMKDLADDFSRLVQSMTDAAAQRRLEQAQRLLGRNEDRL